MNMTIPESISPTFLVPKVPLLRPKRLAELECDIRALSNKKSKNPHVTASARKYSAKKTTSLSQNMSTSKKLTMQKKASHSVVKRSIDFSSLLKNDYPELSKTCKKDNKTSQQNVANKERGSLNDLTFPSSSFSTKHFVITNTKNSDEDVPTTINGSVLRTKTKLTGKTSSSFIQSSAKKNNIDAIKDIRNISNKENTLNVPVLNNSMAVTKPYIKIADQIDTKMYSQQQYNSDLQNLLESNSKILLQMMDSMTSLVENNDRLLKLIEKNNFSQQRMKQNEKSNLVVDSPLMYNLKKLSLANNTKSKPLVCVSSPSKQKKSLEVYAALKTNMKFLKTPKKDGRFNIVESETPNTRSMSIMSVNIQQQLAKLYD